MTLVALPELCLLVRIRPAGMQRKKRLLTSFLQRQQQHLTHYTHNYPVYKRNLLGEATPFIRLAEMQEREWKQPQSTSPKTSLLSVMLSASLIKKYYPSTAFAPVL